ncbi:FAD-dependent oxidoreductase [Dactylosporangium salmoneum]|uniref:Uncharacterized protein n=1 Tax=Dactylosporangium salmoneum TaxID=53361 RepID=A0ABP5U2V6_9ACTN
MSTVDSRVTEVRVETAGSGGTVIRPTIVVDCSGDAVVFALAGAAVQTDRPGRTQPVSLLLRLGGVDFGPLLDYARAHPEDFRDGSRIGRPDEDHVNLWGFGALLGAGHEDGRLSWRRTELHLAGWPTRGEAVLNVTRTVSGYTRLAEQVLETWHGSAGTSRAAPTPTCRPSATGSASASPAASWACARSPRTTC